MARHHLAAAFHERHHFLSALFSGRYGWALLRPPKVPKLSVAQLPAEWVSPQYPGLASRSHDAVRVCRSKEAVRLFPRGKGDVIDL